MPDPIADGGKTRMPDDAIERRIAEVLTRDRSSGLCPLDGPCTSCDCFDPLHEYDRANAKAVTTEVVTPELGRLRNRITALEANGSGLLARAERAEAERDQLQMRFDADQDELEALRSEIQALNAELALHVGCRVDLSIGDTLRLIRGEESPAPAPSPVTAGIEAHGETTEAQEG